MHPTEKTDQVLVLLALEDRQAFAPLYVRYVERVRRYMATRASNPQDVEDLTADVFVRAIEGLAAFRNQHTLSFAAWLFTVARHTLRDYVRQQRRRPPHIALDDVAAHDHDTPHGALAHHEATAALHALVTRLPRRRREVILLKYGCGLCNKDIARCLMLDARTVAAHLSRAHTDLRGGMVRLAGPHPPPAPLSRRRGEESVTISPPLRL